MGALPRRGHRLGARRVPRGPALIGTHPPVRLSYRRHDMCGIAGIIYRNGNGAHRIGRDMTRMLQSMKHRGADSTGYAVYRAPTQDLVLRVKLADASDLEDIDGAEDVRRRR